MHDFFHNLLNAIYLYRYVIVPVTAVLLLIIAIKVWWEEVRYFALNVRYGFPVLGRVARFARRPQSPDTSYRGVTWYTSERSLCADYMPYHKSFSDRCDPVFFECCEDYLNKTGQLGRKEKGGLLWLATFALVIFEAVGFAYVLVPFMARNVSPNAANALAWMVAFMLSIILVPLTDLMGKQLHKNSLLSKIRVWHADARKSGGAFKLEPDTRIKIKTTFEDDDKPNYIKILNRIDTGARPVPGWKISAITVLLITSIAIGAYIIRSNTIADLTTEEVNASPFVAAAADPASGGSPFDLPPAARADNKQADQKASNEEAHSKLLAYKTTFVILSVIFVGVQVFGILMGYFYSLAGEASVNAARYIRGFNHSREFVNYYKTRRDRVARDAQAKLAGLQQAVEDRHDTSGSELHGRARGSFNLYVEELEEEGLASTQRGADRRAAVAASKAAAERQVEPVSTSIPSAAIIEAPVALTALAASVETSTITTSSAVEVASRVEVDMITSLGDLTRWSDGELNEMAAELGLPPERLHRKRQMQRKIAEARRGSV